jgi:hypothetical protein
MKLNKKQDVGYILFGVLLKNRLTKIITQKFNILHWEV